MQLDSLKTLFTSEEWEEFNESERLRAKRRLAKRSQKRKERARERDRQRYIQKSISNISKKLETERQIKEALRSIR